MVSSPTARPLLPILILLLSSTGWGFSWMPLQWFSGKGLPGPTLILLAFGVATLIMLPLVMTQKMDFWHNKSLILSIMLFGGMTNVCFQSAMYHGEVVRVMILFYLLPVWSVLGGKFFLKEPFDILRVSTLFLAVVGAFLILGAEKIFAQAPSWIDALALLSGVTFSMNNIVFRHAQNISVALKVFAMFLGTSILIGIVL